MKINTALILCAGYGKRLNPLTLEKPKPLLKINEITLLENCINLIKFLGIKKVIINTFYLNKDIENFINIKKFNLNIKIINDGKEILNTGGGILNMINSSDDSDFMTLNPDTVWNINYHNCIEEMDRIYQSNDIKSILLVVNKKLSFDKNLNGDFKLCKGKLNKNINSDFIYTGCQILNRNLLSSINKKVFSILDVWNELIEKDCLFGFESKNKFYHITNLEIYNKLLKN